MKTDEAKISLESILNQLPKRRQIPQSTYRLQMHHDFGFKDAKELVPYLSKLGVTDAYLSPILKARPGSLHGYDICDHNALNPELGTPTDFDELVQELKANHMGMIVDFVPNHMGIDPETNIWWKDVLANGRSSNFAHYFDIDWDPIKPELKGKVLLPILGDQYGKVLERGELKLVADNGSLSLHYFETRLPVNSFGKAYTHEDVEKLNGQVGDPRSFDALHALLEKQAYRLAFWKTAFHEINYRRFFDVKELAGLRMEVPEVFAATHRFTLELISAEKILGLRLDHPDGLYDPEGYFEWLQDAFLLEWLRVHFPDALPADWKAQVRAWRVLERKKDPNGLAARPLYLVAEKIISTGETLPAHWSIHGTSGYDFLNDLNCLFVDARNSQLFQDLYQELANRSLPFEDIVYYSKRLIASTSMASELNMLAHELNRISEADRATRDFTLESLRVALREVAASFPVYRTYMNVSRATISDRELIAQAIGDAKKRNLEMEPSIFDFIRTVLVPENADKVPLQEFRREQAFAMKFQQYTGPLQAKGLEDTAFYRYNVLVSLNEVGGDPRRFGTTPQDFHASNERRRKNWPAALLATSTHDTKLGEDVRARIHVLSEIPDQWKSLVQEWLDLHKEYGVDSNDKYRFYQVLLGAWPFGDEQAFQDYPSRMQSYMTKAVKEAKLSTSWINANEVYEQEVDRFVHTVLSEKDSRFLSSFAPFARQIAERGVINSLSQTLLKIASPGMPDFYQGTELWDLNLVDPDNRRPVDFVKRKQVLEEMAPWLDSPTFSQERLSFLNNLVEHWEDGRVKMFLTASALRLRRSLAPLFVEGDYVPLHAEGAADDHLISFARRQQSEVVLVLAPRLLWNPISWGEAHLTMPEDLNQRQYKNVLTGEEWDPQCPISDVFKNFPVALLKAS